MSSVESCLWVCSVLISWLWFQYLFECLVVSFFPMIYSQQRVIHSFFMCLNLCSCHWPSLVFGDLCWCPGEGEAYCNNLCLAVFGGLRSFLHWFRSLSYIFDICSRIWDSLSDFSWNFSSLPNKGCCIFSYFSCPLMCIFLGLITQVEVSAES